MKRGLKESICSCIRSISIVATVAPMKRGLKDEILGRLIELQNSSNRCPDEEGTERPYCLLVFPRHKVATVAPMKRGLKVLS